MTRRWRSLPRSHRSSGSLLDAVFLLADASAALKAFGSLAKLLPEIRAARSAEEAEQIIRSAVPEGGEEFTRRVAAEARAGEEISMTERIFGQEGRALEEAGRLPEREAAQAVLAEIRTAAGETIKVTKSGGLVICSSPCQWLRDRFARQIARDSTFEGRIKDLEIKAAFRCGGNRQGCGETPCRRSRQRGKASPARPSPMPNTSKPAASVVAFEEFSVAERVRGRIAELHRPTQRRR